MMLSELQDKITERVMPLPGVSGVGLVLIEGNEVIEVSVIDDQTKKDVIRILRESELDKNLIEIIVKDRPKLQ